MKYTLHFSTARDPDVLRTWGRLSTCHMLYDTCTTPTHRVSYAPAAVAEHVIPHRLANVDVTRNKIVGREAVSFLRQRVSKL